MACSGNGENNSQTSRLLCNKLSDVVFLTTQAARSPILWQNPTCTVTLLDIPHSIIAAQGGHDEPFNRLLVSSSRPLIPFPSNEPKSASARLKVGQNSVDGALHAEYRDLLECAIEDVKKNWHEAWCYVRPYVEERPRAAKRRRLDLEFYTDGSPPVQGPEDEALPGTTDDSNNGCMPQKSRLAENDAGQRTHSVENISTYESENGLFHNDKTHTILVRAKSPITNNEVSTFYIPPKASFYPGDCADPRPFQAAIRNQAQQTDGPRKFDFILLDPPWPNRSIKRTYKTPNSAYPTASTLQDLRELLLNSDLDLLMADDCLVGIWITNKPAVRELVLGQNGIFACWGVELTEEWLWLKTTVYGEPLTPLDGVWRKPYEVLLLGRKRRISTAQESIGVTASKSGLGVIRRVIIGVPDLHSRKPCVKELIEPLMKNDKNYRALEVFARHLVAGWWSWGNECIKFNWEGSWRETPRGNSEEAVFSKHED